MQILYVVGSLSNAMRGKQLLGSRGIQSYVRKVKASDRYGCGYGLSVARMSVDAPRLLREGGVTVIDVQRRDDL